MQNKLRVGIAGYGVVGRRRREVIDQNLNLETVAVSDKLLPEGTMDDGVRCYSDAYSLMAENLDVLFVSLPNDLAPKVTIEGLKQGCHVFCEKPPGRDLKDIISVIRVEKMRPNQKLKYGFNHRYHDSVGEAMKLIKSKKFGDLINLRGVYGKSKIVNFASDWRTERSIAGGGILLDQGIHLVDMMRLFAGEFTKIYSFISNDYWRHDVEDNAYALMRTEKNIVAMLHSSATQWRHQFRLEITLTKGAIVLGGILSGSKSYGDETMTTIYKGEGEGDAPTEKTASYSVDHSWKDEIDEFTKAIVDDKPILYGTAQDALKTMELVYKIYCADADWKERFQLSCEIDKNLR
jgi:predicted dehydrogenase